MDFAFSNDQDALRASVREVLADQAGPRAYRTAMSTPEGTDAALWRTIGELGWAGVAIDESAGGLGLGLVELCIIAEELGRAVAPVPFVTTTGIAAQIAQGFSGATRDDLFAAIASGETVAAALGRASEGPDGVTVSATATAGGWRLSGVAPRVPEAHLASRIVVAARTPGGISAFVIPSSALATAPVPEASLDACRRLADVDVEGVVIPASALLGDEGTAWPVIARGIERAAVVLAAEAVGVADAVRDLAVAYAREREQFGRPIGSFQAISHRCADMMLWTETARSHTFYAAWALEEGTADASLAAASAKAAAADAVRQATNDAIQVHGGIGFTWEHDLHLFYRRGKFCELTLGDAGIWRERIASLLAVS